MGLIFNGNGDVIKAVDGSLTVEGLDFGGISNVNAGIGTFSGNLNVGGVLTYEDVKNVDSVGIVTARGGLNVTANTDTDTLNVSGISTFGGVVKIPTVAGTNTNAALGVLFQTAAGVIDGGSNLTYNPGGDVLSVNGNHISINTFRGNGDLGTLTCDNHSSTTFVKISSKADIGIKDNTAGAFNIKEGSNEYITIDTTNSSELIKFGTGGTERLRITGAGRVGINETSPDTDLHIKNTNPALILEGTNGSGRQHKIWTAGTNSETLQITSGNYYNNADIHFFRASNESTVQARIDNTGIGIGGVTPARELHVHSNGSGSTYISLTNGTTGTTTGDGFGIGLSGDEEAKLWNYENTPMIFATNSTERLRINSSGQVSIGNNPTVASDAALHIELDGTREYLRLEGDGGTSNAYLEIEAPNNRRKAIIFKSGGTRRGVIGVGDSDEAANATSLFFTASSNIAGDSPHMIITSSGRVVIGDTDTDNAVTDSDNLVIGAASGDNGLTIVSQSGNYNGTIRFSDGANSGSDSYRGTIQYYHGDNYMRFYTNAVERLRINSSGAFGLGGATYGSSGQVLTSAGSGSAPTWSTVSGTTINTNADNRIITGSGTANTLNGESNLTYDGSQITSTVSANDKGLKIVSTGNHGHLIEFQSNRTGADNILGIIGGKWDSNQVAQIRFMTGTDTTNKDEGAIGFHIMEPGGTMERRFMLNQSGKLKMSGTGNANSTDEGVIHVENKQANDPYITDLMDEFMAGSAFNSTSDGRATVRVEWAKGYANSDTTQANVGLLIDGLSAYSGPSIGVCSWARAQVGNGGGINFYGRQESVYGLDYGFYGYRKRSPSSGYGQVFTAEVESALLATNYGMKIVLKARTGSDSYAQGIWIEEANSGTRHAMKFTRGGTEKGSIKTTSSATQFNTSSDYRLKENNVPITDGIVRVKQLKPYRFNWKGETDVVDGFFAHEAQTVVPESVSGTKDEVKNVYPDTASPENPTPDPIGTEPEYQQMDHSKLVPLLTAALKEAITEIENLKAEVAALKSS